MLRVQPNFDNRLEQAGGSIVTLKNFDNRLFFQQGGGGDVVWPDITTAAYTGDFFSVINEESNPMGLFLKPDGGAFYVCGNSTTGVHHYELPTPWDVSTAIYNGKFISSASQDTFPEDIFISPNGLDLYILGYTNKRIYQYLLSTPWDISTAIYTGKSFSVNSENGSGTTGLFFNPDGSSFYTTSSSNDSVYQYQLSIPWDISTATYTGKSLSVVDQDTVPGGVDFRPDGTGFYMVGLINDLVHQYSLSTPWDLSTAIYDGLSFSVKSQDDQPRGVRFKPDASGFYIVGSIGDKVYQYSLGA